MNKGELIDQIANKSNLSQKRAGEILDLVLESILAGVSVDGKVTLVGFGTFEIAEKKARKGRHPQTGEAIEIPEKKVPRFSPGKNFKDKVAS